MVDLNRNLNPESLPRYDSIQDQINPGDVIVFSGSDLPSTVVKVATHSNYVHVAIVLATKPLPSLSHHQPSGDSILIAESHIDTSLPSVGTGKTTLGVQFQWLTQRLATCQGPIWWAALQTPLTPSQIQRMQAWLREIEAQCTPYDFVQAVGAGMDACDRLGFENTPDDSAFFCSELVIRALQEAGVLGDRINPSEQTPADIMQLPCFNSPVQIK